MEPSPILEFSRKPVIGMIHLLPLPGSPGWEGSWDKVLSRAEHDARILVEEGADALLLENFGDAPFHPVRVPPVTVAAMARALSSLIGSFPEIPWGVNVLRNDAAGAVSVAAACGAAFIRVNVHCGATVTDQGILEGRADRTLRLRAALCPGVRILADARVKHGAPLRPLPLEEEVRDLVERGKADAVLVTGSRTGAAPSLKDLREAARAAGSVPCLAASGVGPENVRSFLEDCRGVIVGTSIKENGVTTAPVERERVRALLRAARGART